MSTNTPTEKKKRKFSRAHVDYLIRRSISVEFAEEAGLKSLPVLTKLSVEKIKKAIPGIHLPPVTGLFVPYKVMPLDGIPRCRLRPDSRKYTIEGEQDGKDDQTVELPKWLAQAALAVVPYYPPQIQKFFSKTEVPLFIVEAPIKALSLTENGFPAIGLGGVSAGFHDPEEWKKTKHLVLNRELARIDWRNRSAYVIYDAGIENNPAVALGALKLAKVLENSGAKVRLVFIPLVVEGDFTLEERCTFEPEDQGPDDFLGRHGTEGPAKLQELIDQSVPASPVERAKEVMNLTKDLRSEGVVSLLKDLTFVAGLHVGGQATLDQVVAAVAKSGIKKKSFDEALGKLKSRLSERVEKDARESGDLPYLVEQGKLAMAVPKGADTTIRYLANFNAKISAQVIKDDGVETLRTYRVEGTLADGTPLAPLEVSAESFAGMKWASQWGAKAIIYAGRDTHDHLRVAMQHFSNPTATTVYSHVGWREVQGKAVYLHPKGAIGGNDVAVDVALGNAKFGFPDAVESLPDALKAALTILDVGDIKVTLPVLAAAVTSVLSSVFEVDFGVWLVGRSGTFKSSLAALVLSLFGRFDYNNLPGSWFSTGNYLENQLFKWKDAPFVIDNYVPSATSQHRELMAKALRLIQSLGDRSSRGRNDRNNEEKVKRDPRGLVLMTGEDLPPTNESTIGRLLVVDVPKGSIRLEKLRTVREKVDLLPHAMRGYIEWLAADFAERTAQAKSLREDLYSQFHEELRSHGVHERTPMKLATLGAGFLSFLDFAHEQGAVDDTFFDYLREQLMEVFMELGKAQAGNAEATPTDQYIGTLKTLILQGRVTLAPSEEGLDIHTNFGCRAIGWVSEDKAEVQLVPDLAWEAIEDFIGKERWPFKQNGLQKQLKELGLVKFEPSDDDKGRLTCRRTAGRRSVRVLVFHKEVFSEVLGPVTKRADPMLEDTSEVEEELEQAPVFN